MTQQAGLYRKKALDHVCPFGLKAKSLLEREGFDVDDLPWLPGPAALLIGTITVFKAVYIEGRELKCACVGGDSDAPLSFVSLTENLAMIAMGTWTIARWLIWA